MSLRIRCEKQSCRCGLVRRRPALVQVTRGEWKGASVSIAWVLQWERDKGRWDVWMMRNSQKENQRGFGAEGETKKEVPEWDWSAVVCCNGHKG